MAALSATSTEQEYRQDGTRDFQNKSLRVPYLSVSKGEHYPICC
jgi:hypothetical protein